VRNASDIHVYERIAENVQSFLSGHSTSAISEYPPLATTLFFWIGYNPFGANFPITWIIALASSVAATALYCRYAMSCRDTVLFLLAMLISFPLLGLEIVFARFDVYVFLLCFLSWRAHAANRHFEAGCFLALAAALKVVPALAIPMLILSTPRQKRSHAWVGLIAAGIVAVLLCWAVLGMTYTLNNVLFFIQYHNERGMLIESMWSGIAMLFTNIAGQISATGFDHLSVTNADMPSVMSVVAKGFLVAFGLLMTLWMFFRKQSEREYGPALIVMLLAFLGLSPVLSPQYFVWVVPLMMFWSLDRLWNRRNIGAALTIGAFAASMAFATQWIFPMHYFDMMEQKNLLTTIILNLRNFSVFAVMPLLLGRKVQFQNTYELQPLSTYFAIGH